MITIDELRAAEPYWFTDGIVQGRVLLDKTDGELDRILARLGAAEDVERPYDAYLNAFVRGKSAARRGDELGARLHARTRFAISPGRSPRSTAGGRRSTIGSTGLSASGSRGCWRSCASPTSTRSSRSQRTCAR